MSRYHRRGFTFITYLVVLLPVMSALLLAAVQVGRSAAQASAGHGADVARRQMMLDVIRRLRADVSAADDATIEHEGGMPALTLPSGDGRVVYRVGDAKLERTESRGGADASAYERTLGDATLELRVESIERAGGPRRIVWMTFTFPVAQELGPTPTRGLIAAETVGWRRSAS